MPLFRCSCILGGRCNRIHEDDDIPEIKSNNRNECMSTSEKFSSFIEEDALLSLHRPSIGSLSLRIMLHKPGILIHRDLILTSHGNLPDVNAALDAEFVLCYLRYSSHRRRSTPPKTIVTRRLEAHRFFLTDATLDLTLVACEPVENIPEITPLPIHQHLGSMDLLEEGHRVYIVGHLQSNEMRGILSSGSGRTSAVDGVGGIANVCNNALVAFGNEPKKGNELWMPGSAGFDEHGEFAFMVIDPYGTYMVPEASFKRPSLEASIAKRTSQEALSVAHIVQFGVPLYVIQDWMLMHGIRDLDNLPDQRQLIYPMLDKSASSSTSIADNSPLIPHSNLALSDRNSISYMVLNAGHLVLESKPRMMPSPMGSFNSCEASSIGKETTASDKSSRDLFEINSSLTCINKEEETLRKENEELPTASCTLNHDVSASQELLYLKMPSSSQGNNEQESTCISTALPCRSISEKTRSYPLKWHSRTLPSSYKTRCAENGDWLNAEGSCQSLEISSNYEIKELNHELIHNLSSANQAQCLPHTTNSCTCIEDGVTGDSGKPAKISVSSDQIYEEISLASPKSVGYEVGAIDRCDRKINEKLNDQLAGQRHSLRENRVSREELSNDVDAEMQSEPVKDDNDASEKETERNQREEQLNVSAVLILQGNEISMQREERQEGQYGVGAIISIPRNNSNSERGEEQEGQSDMGANNMPGGDAHIEREEQQEGQANVGGTMYMQRDNASRQHSFSSSSSSTIASSSTSSLRPEEVSRRIQGYGNVSMLNMNASVRSMKEGNMANRVGSNVSASSPPSMMHVDSSLKNRFLDVGSSLVSGLWIKTSLNKAPHSDDYPT